MTEDYRDWLRREALKIESDGCSHALEVRRDHCLEHDLSYHYGRDPQDAYRLWKLGHSSPWTDAISVGKVTADWRLGWGSRLLWRFPATLLGGWLIWRGKRKDRI
jgi:hypothetical protein